MKTNKISRSKISLKKRNAIYEKYGRKCAYCGHVIPNINDMEIDHIKSFSMYKNIISRSELNSIDNLNPACHECNKCKDKKTIEEFRSYLESKLINRLEQGNLFRTALRYNLVGIPDDLNCKKITFYYENHEVMKNN